MAFIGYIGIAVIILLVFVDVFGRYVFNHPLPASYELIEQAMIVLSGFAIMYASLKHGHVVIDLVFNRFTRRIQIIAERIYAFLGFGTWLVIAYYLYHYALSKLQSFESTGILHIRLAPFLFILTIAILLTSLTLLIQTFRPEVPGETPGEKEGEANEP